MKHFFTLLTIATIFAAPQAARANYYKDRIAKLYSQECYAARQDYSAIRGAYESCVFQNWNFFSDEPPTLENCNELEAQVQEASHQLRLACYL